MNPNHIKINYRQRNPLKRVSIDYLSHIEDKTKEQLLLNMQNSTILYRYVLGQENKDYYFYYNKYSMKPVSTITSNNETQEYRKKTLISGINKEVKIYDPSIDVISLVITNEKISDNILKTLYYSVENQFQIQKQNVNNDGKKSLKSKNLIMKELFNQYCMKQSIECLILNCNIFRFEEDKPLNELIKIDTLSVLSPISLKYMTSNINYLNTSKLKLKTHQNLIPYFFFEKTQIYLNKIISSYAKFVNSNLPSETEKLKSFIKIA